MPKPRSKPFERFGTFVLFKKIDNDAIGELWRVAPIEGTRIGPLRALRKLTGDKAAFAAGVAAASPLVEEVEGPNLVRGQRYEVVDGEPCITWEYGGGRSLRHIVDRAREGGHTPIPADQAIALAEKVAAAVDFVSNLKVQGKRILHGTLIPQFVWVYEDGDVRLGGQYLNAGLLASLADPDVALEIGPFVAPEIRRGGIPTRATDVYSIGAILYLTLTGQEPPDSASGDAVDAIAGATLMQSGEPMPGDIRSILERAMSADPAARYTSAAEAKQALSDILAAGNYAPTTFNLAFYLHNLLRKEMEGEAVEREKESRVNAEPYAQEIAQEQAAVVTPRPLSPAAPAPAAPRTPATIPAAPVPAAPAPEPQVPSPLSAPPFAAEGSGKSKAPLIAAVLFAVGASAAGFWYVTKGRTTTPAPAQVTRTEPAPEPAPPTETVVEEEIPLEEPVVTEIPGVEEAPVDDLDAARQKAMEEEVNRRLQAEMRKLQDEYNREIKQQQTAAATEAAPPPPASKPNAQNPAPATGAIADKPATATPEQPAQPTSAAPSTETAAPVESAPPPPPAPRPAVREGDLVVSSELDAQPVILKRVEPVYPPIAAKQKITALIIISALVDEKGKVIDAKVLRGDAKKLGFDEASLRAIRRFTFQPGTKDGKKVKTWHTVPFIYGKQ